MGGIGSEWGVGGGHLALFTKDFGPKGFVIRWLKLASCHMTLEVSWDGDERKRLVFFQAPKSCIGLI